MSDCRERDERIDAYVDGTLSDIERHDLEAHLRSCRRCSAEVESTRSLLERARRLPRSFAPDTDTWPALRARIRRIEADRGAGATRGAGRRWRVLQLAAAIALAAALSSAVTFLALRNGSSGAASEEIAVSPPAPSTLAQVERQYASVTSELATALEARRDELSPDAIATVERSLDVIDAALAEARAALALEPDNPALARMLAAAYEQKLDLLRRATRLSPSS